MTGLRNLLNPKADSSEGTACYTTDDCAGLFIDLAPAEGWVLPWQMFVHARFQAKESNETLTIAFTEQKVTLIGEALLALLEPIGQFKLQRVRAIPAKYAAALTNQPIIESITVTKKAEES